MVREYVEMFRQGLSTTGVAAAAQAARPDSRPAFPLVANGLSSQENQHVE
jgi:hypothetical protein